MVALSLKVICNSLMSKYELDGMGYDADKEFGIKYTMGNKMVLLQYEAGCLVSCRHGEWTQIQGKPTVHIQLFKIRWFSFKMSSSLFMMYRDVSTTPNVVGLINFPLKKNYSEVTQI